MPPLYERDLRLPALRRFAVAITVLNVLGHAVLGFEPSWAHPFVAVATAYAMDLALELIDARVHRRVPRFSGGWRATVDFLLSAHISGLAVAMLLYANERMLPIAFAAAVATGSKRIFRVRVGSGTRHIFNPSNLGITVALLTFPWVSITPPYQFTENVSGPLDWVVTGAIVASGSFLNGRFTGRFPLIGAWLTGFVFQALLRSAFLGASLHGTLMPMTGMSFLLFTFYMVTDPATTPSSVRGQLGFGLSVAALYGVLMVLHVVFGLFFALTMACSLRGLALAARALVQRLAGQQGWGWGGGVPVLRGAGVASDEG